MTKKQQPTKTGHHLYPYPPDGLPSDLFARLLEILRGAPIDIEDAHRLWVCAGFALSQFDPHEPVLAEGAPLTPAKAAELLEAAYPAGEIGPDVQAAGPTAFPWSALLGILLTILQQLLTSKRA